jgi:hypothetical protein
MKQSFTIGGSVPLKKALLEETGIEIQGGGPTPDWEYLTAALFLKSKFDETNNKESTHYQLPQDWDKAIQAVKDFFAEEPKEEAKPETLVLKDIVLSDILSIGEDLTFEIKQYDRVDLHLTATHLQQLKEYFNS